MLRILFCLLLLIHGLIHLIGFFSGWKLTATSILTGKTLFQLSDNGAKISGSTWLLTALLWIVASILYFLRRDTFLIPAIVAIVISQSLIALYWQDAKFGSIANAIVLLVVIVNVARVSFNKNVEGELSAMTSNARSAKNITEKDVNLPPVVKRWLAASKSTGKIPSVVQLEQEGSMRSSSSADWMNFKAVQTYTVDPPAFVWNSQINPGSLMTIAGRDKFENGKGNMLIKPLYIYSLANTSGSEIDQGTMLRYMGELIWFPEAAAMPYFEWEEIDSTSASLKMTYNGAVSKGIFTFDNDGLVKSFSAERFGDFNGVFKKEMWEVRITENRMINNNLIGSKCEVTWKLKEGDFTWLKLEVKNISYEVNMGGRN